jgi:predicted tellurium resistance membrane protein TerC
MDMMLALNGADVGRSSQFAVWRTAGVVGNPLRTSIWRAARCEGVEDMEWVTDPEIWIALSTLTVLELVLGIDNVIFISILAGKLPAGQQRSARTIGLALAMITRILLLLSLAWVIRLTSPLFTILGNEISGRDLILLIGGLFLIGKSTFEIHDKLEGSEHGRTVKGHPSFQSVIAQIIVLDIVFSLDSVITAVGMVQQVPVMVAAVVIAVILMMVFAGPISSFVEEHPTVKMLALSFLLLIGVALIADGLEVHIPRGYIYFAMGFSVMVEMLNLRLRRVHASPPVKLRQPITP